VVELRRAEETVAGTVSVAGAEATGFYGWLELIGLLERAASGQVRVDGASAGEAR
jgi:hypothetical protein